MVKKFGKLAPETCLTEKKLADQAFIQKEIKVQQRLADKT